MSINNTTLLGLAQPVTGQESGVWGDDVNNGLTELVEIAIAGVNNITQDSDITLAVSNGSNSSSFTSTATNSTVAQYYVLNCSGSRTAARNIIVPTTSKTYVITNATTGGYAITIKKSAGTGVTIANGETAIVFYNTISGDVAKVSSLNTFGAITATSITNSGLTSGRVVYSTTGGLETDSANFTFNGTTATINTLNLTNALGTAYGGTGLTSFTANGVVYASSTSALATGAGLTWNPSTQQLGFQNAAANGYAYIGTSGAGTNKDLSFYMGASEVMRLNNAGYLGIGTSSPSQTLDVNGTFIARGNSYFYQPTANTSLVVDFETNNGASVRSYLTQLSTGGLVWNNDVGGNGSSDYFAWQVSSSEKMRLDSSGNLGIGTTSPTRKLDVSNAGSSYIRASDTTDSVYVDMLAASSGGWIGTQSNHAFLFQTNNTERMRIDTSGNLLVGKTSIGDTYAGFQVEGSGAAYPGRITATVANSTNATEGVVVYSSSAGAYRFYVDMAGTIHATSTSISAISDSTLKTNIKPLETGLTQILALQPRRFDWLNGDGTNVAGFISQEVEQVLPDLVNSAKYSVDENGEAVNKLFLKMGDMIPTMVKAIQELNAEIQSLKAEVATLKGA